MTKTTLLINIFRRKTMGMVFLGIKKDYKFSKYIRGNVQTMYNFLDKCYKTSPYADRINMRIGFEFPMKRKVQTDMK